MDDAHRTHAGELAPGHAQAGGLAQQIIQKAAQGKLHALALLRQGRGAHQALTAPPHTRRQPEPARSGKHQILAADVFGRQRGSGEKHAGDVLRLVAGDAALDMNQHKCSLFCIQTNIR